ncbi:MAG: BtpA/SgcQ family protein [Myxococcota bacterium]
MKGLVGVVHLPAVPGDPGCAGSFDDALAAARRDAGAYKEGGAAALIVENFGSAPFWKGTAGDRLPAHQIALITLAVRAVQDTVDLPVGVNCLRNDAMAALGIAAATNAAFVRVNVHTGAYVTDQGLIEGEAAHSLRYRASLGSQTALWADVLVKHAKPLAPLSPTQATEEVLLRGGADAVIVTGRGTGEPIDASVLREVRAAAGDRTVVLGSGVTPATAPALAPFADAAIVGTYVKEHGRIHAPVDARRVAEVAALFPLK